MSGPRRPPGRRPGSADVTRRQIVAAARKVFGEVGFERATIRAIASVAAVDPALIHHHFASKQRLFAVAHELPDPIVVLTPVFTGPPGEMGSRLARAYLELMAAPGSPAISLLRSVATNDEAASMLREFLEDGALAIAEDLLPADQPRRRLALCAAHLIGLVIARSIVALPELAGETVDDLVSTVGPTLQRYLTEPL